MKASELKPKQFFHFTGDSHKQLCRNIGNAYQFLAEEEMSGNEEVIPLDVQGWDDEVKRFPSYHTAKNFQGYWCPDCDPITLDPFFMWIELDGQWVPTYGGPYDSYTLSQPYESKESGKRFDVEYHRLRYCHDEGCWKESQSLWLRVTSEEHLIDLGVWDEVDHATPSPQTPKLQLREVDVGKGWRLLDKNEQVEEGDECEDGIGGWMEAFNWTTASRRQGPNLAYRRKITEVPPPTVEPSPIEQFAAEMREITGPIEIDPEEIANFSQGSRISGAVTATGTAQPDADGWIEHDGNPMPVWLDRHTTIEVETNEHIGELFKGAAGSFYWTLGKNLPSAIKRYRIITPNPTHWTIIDGVEVNQ